jgi:hypothetical protein
MLPDEKRHRIDNSEFSQIASFNTRAVIFIYTVSVIFTGAE